MSSPDNIPPKPLNVLIACESSGTVREAFRKKGHNAWSCDLLPADDGSEHHITDDCIKVIKYGWDIVIAHPPCTHLAVSGARHFAAKRADGRQQQGIDLFMSVVSECDQHANSWAVENPIGIMSKIYRKPNQIVQPWWFGEEASKSTCLWLKNLPLLVPTNVVGKGEFHITASGRKLPKWYNDAFGKKDCWKIRSKTFQGVANAMAEQWG